MSGFGVPPVPGNPFSDNSQRDYLMKEYLEKLRLKLEELENRVKNIEDYLSP